MNSDDHRYRHAEQLVQRACERRPDLCLQLREALAAWVAGDAKALDRLIDLIAATRRKQRSTR